MSATHTLPNPYPRYDVFINNSAAYLVIYVPDCETHEGHLLDVWRIDRNTFEFKKVKRMYCAEPKDYWQDCLELEVIQVIYFKILDDYRENAKLYDIKHLRAIKNNDIPF